MFRLRVSRVVCLCVGCVAAAFLVLPLGGGAAFAGKGIDISARVSGSVRGGAVTVRASCDSGCASVRAAGTLSGPGSLRRIRLATVVRHVNGSSATLALKIPRSAIGKVNAALAKGRKVTASLRVTGLDGAGRSLVTASGTVRLGQ